MKSYAVVFTYSFDFETSVYLFDTEKEAITFLKDSYNEELRIDTEENGWDSRGNVENDWGYASITTYFPDRVDVTEFRLGEVYI